jgi:hypothetical protein
MKQSLIYVAFGLLLPSLSACKKEQIQAPSAVPVVELRSVSPERITALQDSIVFLLAYTDGDGDLGFAEADSAVVYLTDERFPITERFHMPPLAPEGAVIPITGVLRIVLGQTILQDAASVEEPVTFSLRIRDRAGNWSNTVQTEGLKVLRN